LKQEQIMATQAAATIETLLGVNASAGNTRLGLSNAVQSGLPVSALDRLAGAVAPDDARFKFRLIPKATLERRKKSASRHLTSDEGDRLARLAKVYVFALDIYHDSDNVREFLNRPHAMLDGKPPLDVALATGPGADAVINLLGRVAYSGGV
jgi:putative toxin-antitoxin system antitoxin component (TIGR02293 family)